MTRPLKSYTVWLYYYPYNKQIEEKELWLGYTTNQGRNKNFVGTFRVRDTTRSKAITKVINLLKNTNYSEKYKQRELEQDLVNTFNYLKNNQIDLGPDFAQVVEEDFWDLLDTDEDNQRDIWQAFEEIITYSGGELSDLPDDASLEHDHYIYGTPKKYSKS